MYWSQLLRTSRIRHKPSYTKYVNYCVDKGFLEVYHVPLRGHGSRFERNMTKQRYFKYYRITDRGRKFLDLVQ